MPHFPRDEFTLRQVMERPDFECFHYCDTTPPTVEFHDHQFYEILFFLNGNVSYTIEGRTYQLRPGDILLTSRGDLHKPDIRGGKAYERYLLWVQPHVIDRIRHLGADLDACFRDAQQKRHHLVRPDSAVLTHLKQICQKMLQTRDETEFGSSTLSLTYLVEFLVYLNRAYFATPDAIRQDITENEKINQVLAYINTHLSEDLSLDRLSQALFVSKSHLNRSFKDFTGLTLYQYIIKKRLVVARNMLLEGEPVMNACMRCGFSDYSNFLKAFKREFGRSPRDFMVRK